MIMIFLGLGSNIGDRENNIIKAIRAINKLPEVRVTKVSSLYETAPVGYLSQDYFLNAVVAVDTTRSPLDLLSMCLSIEKQLGRVREFKWGPRIIDIDILIYNNVVCNSKELILPHPRLGERKFVLVPLAEISKGVIIYNGSTAEELLKTCEANEVKFYGQLNWEEK